MDSFLAWNVRGLNRPNKREDIKCFLNKQDIVIVSLLETKVKKENIKGVADRLFRGWSWVTNVEANPDVRIWQGKAYKIQVLSSSEQLIHCNANSQINSNSFFITFVYGLNQLQLRNSLWQHLRTIATTTGEPWCILGDFNAVLKQEEQLVGEVVQHGEIKEFQSCTKDCDLQEIECAGAQFTWMNKTVWSKIDRLFVNSLWY